MIDLQPYWDKWKWLAWTVVVSLLVYLGLRYLLPILLPFLISLLLAKMAEPMVKALHERWGVSVKLATPIVLLLIMTAFLITLFLFGVALFNQVKGVLVNFPVYQNKFIHYIGNACQDFDELFRLRDGESWRFVNDNADYLSNVIVEKILPTMTKKTLMAIVWAFGALAITFIVFISALLILEDMEEWDDKYRRSRLYPYLHPILGKLANTGTAFIRAQAIILGSVALSCSVGLWLIGNPYFLLLGLLIAVMDAFPILGSGMALVPWALVEAIRGDFYQASVLITLYTLCLTIREVLEPKLVGNRIGVKPLFILMASFIGIHLFGFSGVFLGPIALVTIKVLLSTPPPKRSDLNS